MAWILPDRLRLLCHSFDPWWTKTADPMTRHFLADGTLLGVPAHEPYWMPDAECRCALYPPPGCQARPAFAVCSWILLTALLAHWNDSSDALD